jgi:hypothetical protein
MYKKMSPNRRLGKNDCILSGDNPLNVLTTCDYLQTVKFNKNAKKLCHAMKLHMFSRFACACVDFS